jgi:hypothetical protein
MHLVGGVLQGIDWDHRRAIIGGQPFELLPGLAVVSGLGPGTRGRLRGRARRPPAGRPPSAQRRAALHQFRELTVALRAAER